MKMTDDFDLNDLLQDLNEQEQQTLVNAIPGLLTAARDEVVAKRPKTPEDRIASMAAEYDRLAKEPTRNAARMTEIEKEMDTYFAAHPEHTKRYNAVPTVHIQR
jgi:hypothetical protein